VHKKDQLIDKNRGGESERERGGERERKREILMVGLIYQSYILNSTNNEFDLQDSFCVIFVSK
jgi:hypothetical protein